MNREQKRIFWEKHIRAYISSGQSQKMYCQAHNIALSSFCYWKRKTAAKYGDASRINTNAPMIVPVSLGSVSSLTAEEPIRLYAAGVCLELKSGFCQKTLQDVLSILKALQ